MRLVTYNLNGIRARLPRLIEYLDREKPDILCLQELKCADDALPISDIEGAGYHAVWHGQKGFNGVAILSRSGKPILRQIGLPGDPDDSHSRYIEAEIDGLIVASIYLPNGNPIGTEKFDYKLQWMERLRIHAAGLLAAATEDRDSVEALLAVPHRMIAGALDVSDRKRVVGAFQFLETDDVGLFAVEIFEEAREPGADSVEIVGDQFH